MVTAAPPDSPTRWSRIGRILGVSAFVAMALLWAYAFSPWAPNTPPDRLADTSFAEAAEPVCAAAMARIDDFPKAYDVATPLERAELIEDTTAILADMVGELRTIAPPRDAGEDEEVIHRWLDDWEIYLGDRLDYASDFRAGIDRQFTVTEKDGDQVTDPIDGFANANDMTSCEVPDDV